MDIQGIVNIDGRVRARGWRLGQVMKIIAGCIVVAAAVISLAAAREAGVGPFTSSLHVTLPAPNHLSQWSAVHAWRIRPGGWIKGRRVRFSVSRSRVSRGFRLQIQLAKNGGQPSGSATATEPPGSVSPSVVVRGLGTGVYRWWARFYNGRAVSPWVSFSSGTAYGVDYIRPSAPRITSATDPVQAKVYRSGTVRFDWTSTDTGSGIAGYLYRFGPPSPTPSTRLAHISRSSLSLSSLATGNYMLTIEARDRAGNLSAPATYRIRLDSTPPSITHSGFSDFSFNPRYSSMTINYRVSRPAWVHIGIYRQSDNHRVRFVVQRATRPNQLLHYTWHGRTAHGVIVGPGAFDFYVRTTDAFGNTSIKEYSGLNVINQRIVVSLSQQRLWAYNGNHQFLTSPVTTGNRALPTPTGVFTILAKYHPFTFISPAPPGSQDYYPPSPVNYAMLFRVGGYYIHDAPWRSVFGPGSNAQTGTPGQNYTGSHGCVNVPANTAYQLFQWATDGTPVLVIN